MGKGIAIATLVLSVAATIIIFVIFPPNPINIIQGITLGLIIYTAIHAEENHNEF
jgi:hypothetical protein